MAHTAKVEWLENMAFQASINGHSILMDADPAFGGNDQGPRPKLMLLAGLGGCTGMDVVPLLAKMKVVPEKFWMEISAELADEHPKIYKQISITYYFKGKDLPFDKLEKAVHLSKEKYCAVSAMLSKSAEMSFEIIVKE